MPFDPSLPDVPVNDGATALRCKYVDRLTQRRCVWMYDHEDKRHHNGCYTWTEPKGSGGSSSDDRCAKCGHSRRSHLGEPGAQCLACPSGDKEAWGHAFVPAEPETAGEPECTCPTGPWRPEDGPLEPDRDCPVHGDDWGAGEPEAPHEHDWTEWGAVYHGGDLQWRDCRACGDHETRQPEAAAYEELAGDRPSSRPRPSYAVAYAIGSGALYTLVLPDEMTCAVVDGVLVLSHPSGVLGIQQVNPLEGQ